MAVGKQRGGIWRALATAGLLLAVVASQVGQSEVSGAQPSADQASALDGEIALAHRLLSAVQDTSKPPAQRALDTARLALDARLPVVDDRLKPLLSQQAHNLDTAQELLDLGSPEGADTLAFGIDVAKVATGWQAETMGLDLTPIDGGVSHDRPSDAIAAFIEAQGGKVDAVVEADLRHFDTLPGPAATALANLVDAFSVFASATHTAYAFADQSRLDAIQQAVEAGDLDAIGLESTAPGEVLAELGIDLGPVLSARNDLLSTVVPLRDALAGLNETQQASPEFQLAPYISIELLGGDTTYSQDFMLVIDALGNDTYLNNAGGARGLFMPAAGLVDLLGTDQYRSLRSQGINGGGSVGSGLLIDVLGQDTYQAGSFGTNGGGSVGTGLLIDTLGHNQFSAGDDGTNGGGVVGLGMLIDVLSSTPISAGRDATNGGAYAGSGFLYGGSLLTGTRSYVAGNNGTNGGASEGGAGFLISAGNGTDSYSGGGGGVNGGGGSAATDAIVADTLGGTGFLFDVGGSDTVTAGGHGVNGGGNVGAGMLLDGAGNDALQGGDTGVNGGASVGSGFLIDGEGNDTRVGTASGVNGGSSFGTGLLVDGTGADTYRAGTGSTNGAAFIAVAALIDGSGNDTYAAGASANGTGFLGTGLLFDGLGTDSYTDADGLILGVPSNGSGWDRTVVPKGVAGGQIDNPPPSPVPTTLPTVTTTSVPLPPTTLPTVTTSTLPTVTTSTLPTVTTSTLPTVTTSTLPTVTTSTLPTVTTSTLPPVTTSTLPPVTTSTLPPIPTTTTSSSTTTTTTAPPPNSPPAAPTLVAPSEGHEFRTTDLQEFRVTTTDPEGDDWFGTVEIRDEGDEVVRELDTSEADSGEESSAILFPPLLPGTYTWSATATDSEGDTSAASAETRSFKVVPSIASVVTIDFEDTAPCTTHAFNDDALLGIWHSPVFAGPPYSICVLVRFPIPFTVRVTVDPDGANP